MGGIKVLVPRLKQTEIHKKNKPFYDEYKALSPSKQKKYFAEHKKELDLFKSANVYLNKHRDKDGTIPLASWIKEYQELTAEKKEISKSTMSLSERLRQIERIRKRAKEDTPKQPQRNRGWDMER